MRVYSVSVRPVDGRWDWVGDLEGRSNSFCGNLGYFLGLTISKVHTCWLFFDHYCLLIGPKAKLLGIQSTYFALAGSREMFYGRMGSTRVGFCSF
jgi:hypothetical protein